ncbi:MAG: tRNA (adenine(22)-N(1))-methyltransferase TrmK, partial [Clostridia bacterium]|nr:tRNA (adenine(22)-N(1))-methyltransferase TrmK [Clostridia bacterium]
MRLSPRLLAVAGLVPEKVVAADVGTGHGLLAVYLVTSGRCPRVIATDLRSGPLQEARRAASAFGVEDLVVFRQGRGLRPQR